MDKEKIEKAAHSAYINTLCSECAYETECTEKLSSQREENYINAFKFGAEWALQNQWVSVKERLPEEDMNCLVRCRNLLYDTYIAIYTLKEKTFSGFDHEGYMTDFNVTHWMPIPEPPTTK